MLVLICRVDVFQVVVQFTSKVQFSCLKLCLLISFLNFLQAYSRAKFIGGNGKPLDIQWVIDWLVLTFKVLEQSICATLVVCYYETRCKPGVDTFIATFALGVY